MTNDNNSLAHTSWNCKNHIVFAPQYRRQIFYGEHKKGIGKILRELCDWKEVKIVEAEVCPDHVHMLVEIPPKLSVSSFMGFLKGKSSLLIHERHGNLKYKYGNRSFRCRILCRHSRKECKEDRRVHKESIERGSGSGSNDDERIQRPVYG